MSEHNDSTCLRTLSMLGVLLFGFFLAMIFLARTIVY
jgi:hypothetical protein